ncbi:MAG: FtsX-like permease family protein, partial [Verrucomicrobiota bacterium]
LGGLGLLLGSFGLGIVVLRNVLERRSELGLLRAVGFTRGRVLNQLITEHGVLLLAGLLCGVAPAALALVPSALTPGADLSYDRMAFTAAGILLNGFLWTVFAALFALKGGLIQSLRNE